MAATRRVSFSLRFTDPSPSYSDSDCIATFGWNFIAPFGSTFETPKKASIEASSLPSRVREVELRISASSSISMTTVRMSPSEVARRSPSSPVGVLFQSEPCW